MIKVSPAGLVDAVMSQLDDIMDQVNDRAETSVKIGETLVKEHISTRGTAKSGKAGRIETGAMLRGVTSNVETRSSFLFRGRFGMKTGPAYSVYQEGGFRHNRSGQKVEGMFAVADAADEVANYLRASMRGIN